MLQSAFNYCKLMTYCNGRLRHASRPSPDTMASCVRVTLRRPVSRENTSSVFCAAASWNEPGGVYIASRTLQSRSITRWRKSASGCLMRRFVYYRRLRSMASRRKFPGKSGWPFHGAAGLPGSTTESYELFGSPVQRLPKGAQSTGLRACWL